MPVFLEKALHLWRLVPFRHVLLAVIFLSFWGKHGWGEHFPFTNFPMYSELDEESDVLYVTDQADRPLPFHTLFGTSLSTQKKNFIKEVAKISNKAGRDSRDALPEERQKAGAKVARDVMPRLKRDRLEPGVETLRFYYKVFRAEGDKIIETTPQLVAEQPLSPPAS
jgi:hypothetical protein